MARSISILGACSAYMLSALFFGLLVSIGTHKLLMLAMAAAGAIWLWDTYMSRGDYIIRLASLGAGYGVAAAGVATLFN